MEGKGSPRLTDLEEVIAREAFSAEEREKVRQLEEAIKAGGYDADAHEAARKAELAARDSETEFHALEKARAALDGLRREIANAGREPDMPRKMRSGPRSIVFTDLQKKLSAQKETLPDLAGASGGTGQTENRRE